jgi:hypothetical protein
MLPDAQTIFDAAAASFSARMAAAFAETYKAVIRALPDLAATIAAAEGGLCDKIAGFRERQTDYATHEAAYPAKLAALHDERRAALAAFREGFRYSYAAFLLRALATEITATEPRGAAFLRLNAEGFDTIAGGFAGLVPAHNLDEIAATWNRREYV